MKSWIPDARNFAYLTWKQVDALSRETTVLVLPTAAIEQHGQHLPLATDTLINSILLGAALARLPQETPVYALPAICYGKSNEHIGFPGNAFCLRFDLHGRGARYGRQHCCLRLQEAGALQHPWRQLVAGGRNGARSAGGVWAACLLAFLAPEALPSPGLGEQERTYGFHAGEVETSFLLSAIPELVHTSEYTVNYIADIAKPELLRPENAPATFAWLTRDIAPSGVMGDPNPASGREGNALD